MNLEDYLLQKTPSNTVGSLPCFVKGGGLDALIQTWSIMSQIARGVEYIHSEHQIHRDIKPGNGIPVIHFAETNSLVLYSSKDHLWKLADFGLSVEGSSKTNRLTTSSKGTPGYRSPELLEFEGEPSQHTNRVDIWAMGCILYQLVTGTQLFKSDWAVIYHVYDAKSVDVPLDNTFDADSTQIITKYIVDMLQVKPAERPSAATLSAEFNRQLELARHRAGLSYIVTEIEEPKLEAPTASQKPRVVSATVDPVTAQTEQIPQPLQQDSVASNSSKIHGQNLPSHLIGVSLHDVAFEGDLETVKALISAGADVNSQGYYGNALQIASSNGNIEMVRLLLENGADMNAQGGRYGNALQGASRHGHEAVVRLLLEKGAEVNAQALQAASSQGHEAVVRLLREKDTRSWRSRMANLLKHGGTRTS